MDQKILDDMIHAHKRWTQGNPDGEQANFADENLQGLDLSRAKLRSALFWYADLAEADLHFADLESAEFHQACLVNANLSDADLMNAVFKQANLRYANLRSTRIYGANFSQADLRGADLTNTDMDADTDFSYADLRGARFDVDLLSCTMHEGAAFDVGFAPEDALALGCARQAVRLVEHKGIGLSPKALKSLFGDTNYARVAADLAGRPATAEMVDQLLTKYGLSWKVTRTFYAGPQRITNERNKVVQLNVDKSMLSNSKHDQQVLRAIEQLSYQSDHPVLRGQRLMTVGWARYLDFMEPSVLLVEEVQSDLPLVRFGLKDPGFRAKLEERDIDPEDIERVVGLLSPFSDRFYCDVLALLLDQAYAAGQAVEMLSYEAKAELLDRQGYDAPPKSVYHDLPKRMGMKLVRSAALPHLRAWRIVPNGV